MTLYMYVSGTAHRGRVVHLRMRIRGSAILHIPPFDPYGAAALLASSPSDYTGRIPNSCWLRYRSSCTIKDTMSEFLATNLMPYKSVYNAAG